MSIFSVKAFLFCFSAMSHSHEVQANIQIHLGVFSVSIWWRSYNYPGTIFIDFLCVCICLCTLYITIFVNLLQMIKLFMTVKIKCTHVKILKVHFDH